MRVSAHYPLAFALQNRVIARTRKVGVYRAGHLIYRPAWRNDKQRRLYYDAAFGRMFAVAEGFIVHNGPLPWTVK